MTRSALAIVLYLSTRALAEPNVGIVDVQRVIDSSAEGQAARQRIKALVDSRTVSPEEVASRERDALEPIFARVNAAAAQLAADHRLVAVLDRSNAGVVAATPSLDLTPELIARVEKTGGPSPNAADASRVDALVGFVDMQRVFATSVNGAEAKKRLKKRFEVKQRQIDAAQERVRAQKRAFDASGESVSSPSGQALTQSLSALQALANDGQKELSEFERRELAVLIKKLDPLLIAVANEAGYAFIFDARSDSSGPHEVLWSDKRRDLTDELIRRSDGHPARPLMKLAGTTTTLGFVDTEKLPLGGRDAAARLVAEGRVDLLFDKAASNLVFARASFERTGEVLAVLQGAPPKLSAPGLEPVWWAPFGAGSGTPWRR